MQRLHLMGLGLMLSATLSAPAWAQMSSASPSDTVGTAKTANASQAMPPAATLIDQAVKVAKASHKTVFVHVGASWCGWCHKLDEMLASKEVGSIIDAHYVVVPLIALEQDKSLENPGVDSVMNALGLHDGPPLYAFIDADGKEITSSLVMPNNGNIGYPGTPEEIAAFGGLLQKTAPQMSAADRAKITDYLTRSVSGTP